MNRFFGVSLSLILGSGIFMLVNAQEAQKNAGSEQVRLQDQNLNQGTTKNQEQNRIIHGSHFVDKDGDGFHDYAPDQDQDGIPNGRDADYQGAGKGQRRQNFVDQDGDGIADTGIQGRGLRSGRKGRTGYGPASANCDGTGPRGKTQRLGQK